MNKEEKKAIEDIKKDREYYDILMNIKNTKYNMVNVEKLMRNSDTGNYTEYEIAESIVYFINLVEKQQKEIEQLANGIRVLGTNPDMTTEEIIKEFTEKPITEEYMEKFKSRYISKDKILKAIGYEEDDEEYERLKQDDEKLLAILDTMYSEVCRLEDIEDQKVEVAIAFIEEKRDKYWQEKINNKIKELESIEPSDDDYNFELQNDIHSKIDILKELLEEK